MRPTIKDVARLAGCSIKTVSRVINSEPYVSDDIKTRVQVAIRTLGYAPNISAKRLVQKRSYTLCILMYPAAYQSSSAILSRIMDLTYEAEYDILVQNYYPTLARSKNRLVDLIHENRMDGFISTPPCDADGFVPDLLKTYRVPLVEINPLNPSPTTPCVIGDDYEGACTMVEHLIRRGYTQIGFLRGPRNIHSSDERYNGYKDTLHRHHLEVNPDWVMDSEFTFDGGFTAARLILQMEDHPNAIYAGNDEAALGVIYACQMLGIRIPQQLAVGGHDDNQMAKYVFPGLTTIHQPMEDLIESALQVLIGILRGEEPERFKVQVPAWLVERGSTSIK